MNTSFYTSEELSSIPFRKIGGNVLISKKCSIYSPEEISIGDYVRIDDFCILSGHIEMGSYIHISAYAALYGKFGIYLEDFVTISVRALIFSQNDDYSGSFLTNPMVPQKYRNVNGGAVNLRRFSIIGAGAMIMPGITLQEGAAIGAMSLVTKTIPEWSIAVGIPAKILKARNQDMAKLANSLLKECS